MKKILIGIAATLILAAMSFAAQTRQTFTGQIMDSGCAALGSHAMMMASHGMAGKENDPAARKACTLDCVKNGAKFVLYNPATKTTYQLDNQKTPQAYAGEDVKVTGTLNANTNTIHVTKISKS